MPNFCAVYKCGSRGGRDKKSFFRLPSEDTREGEKTLELSRERRRKWLAAINRHFEHSSLKNIRVCSDHFISGKPAYLYDTTNPDWVPSLNLGYNKGPSDCDDSAANVADRHRRLQARGVKRKVNEAADALLSLQEEEPLVNVDERDDSGIGCQTTLDGDTIFNMDKEMRRLMEENRKIKDQLAIEKSKFDENYFKHGDDDKVKYFTGLPKLSILLVIFEFLKEYLPHSSSKSLSKFQCLVMTLMKLRLNLSHIDLGERFGITKATVSRLITTTIDVMHIRMKPLILWPEREQIRETMPLSFREHFGKRVAVIIDCFELFLERPSNLAARATWSSYKHNNTTKYLIGITPQGVISYISKGWGGRVSDKYLVEHSDFVRKLDPGDIVLADRGFNIADSVGLTGAEIRYPAFTRGKKQLSGQEVESTRRIANVRIHVERVIGSLRQKYSILHSTLPIEFVTSHPDDKMVTLDKIVTICCGLVNMCPSVVPLE